jgi:hypothetical protein
MQANAQTTQLSFTSGVFNFSGSTFSASTDVVFNYYTVNGSQTVVTPFNAFLTLSGTVGSASEATLSGQQISVSAGLTNVSETITAAQSGFGITSGQTLVAFANQSATLSGAGKTISFSFTSPNAVFSSDVFQSHLYGPESENLQLTPSSVLSVTGSTTNYGAVAVTTGTLNGFTATGGSNVFNAASVPEASTLLGLGGLVLGGGFIGLRRRK